MSNGSVIIDTGPIVAYLVEADANHSWTMERFQELRAPFRTCEAVLTEAFYLLCRLPHGARYFFDLLDIGLVEVEFGLFRERHSLRRLIMKYQSVPMSLADACVVKMSEQNHNASVFTLDSDFRIYRRLGRQRIPLIIP